MSGDFLMARTRLPADVVDLGVGEPHFLREEVVKAHRLETFDFVAPHIWEYAPPYGYPPLVELLESLYGTKVVVTIGAKHGIFAALHAFHEKGIRTISYRSPYWASFPHMMERAGLQHKGLEAESHLVVLPNNPDGAILSPELAKKFCSRFQPCIHDAAYYTRSYLPEEYPLVPLGDMQVFSASKMFGLSGLRLGWVVCHNPEFYPALLGYVEATTAGVSTASQRILLSLLEAEALRPEIQTDYSTVMRNHLSWGHQKLKEVNPEVFEVRSTLGMFGWCRKGPKWDPNRQKVNVMDGEAFGDPSSIRLNLAVSKDQLEEAVRRFNVR